MCWISQCRILKVNRAIIIGENRFSTQQLKNLYKSDPKFIPHAFAKEEITERKCRTVPICNYVPTEVPCKEV